ncbi:MAG TPA: xanthine dehydrogenase family protein subunit M [Candidatus Binataceae bacterium]|nr:xanthine dehydrogenase family protein subunit M [Candidatus Binataceae bacterium]
MYPSAFDYHRAASVKDALKMLSEYGEDGKLLAGGHSLIPIMKLRLSQPAHLIDLGGVRELATIREEGGKIVVGAMATHRAVQSSAIVRAKLGLLAECAAVIGDIQVRNRGTIGGSIAHADPAADYPAAVLALEGEITIEGAAGRRVVKAADFFLDLMTTAVRPGEIVTQLAFAPIPAGRGFAYLKHRQPASGFAMVGVAAVIALAKNAACESARVGITGLGAKPFRAKTVESALAGKPPARTIAAAAARAADGIDALADIHASAEFRAELARVYTRRALEAALARAAAA